MLLQWQLEAMTEIKPLLYVRRMGDSLKNGKLPF